MAKEIKYTCDMCGKGVKDSLPWMWSVFSLSKYNAANDSCWDDSYYLCQRCAKDIETHIKEVYAAGSTP